MRVKIEMEYSDFVEIRSAINTAASMNETIILSYDDNLSEYIKTRIKEIEAQLKVANELFFQAYLKGI